MRASLIKKTTALVSFVITALYVLPTVAEEDKKSSSVRVHETLQSRLDIHPNTNTARNIILFIGDGMGVSTVTAARIFDGQSRGESGEENSLSFEHFPHIALIKTYNTNQQVPDSAGTATAMHTGQKTRAGLISVGPETLRGSCAHSLTNPLNTIVELAEQNGKATGIVTTTRITHATPATLYAHTPERDWESDRYIPEQAKQRGCKDIARQLIEFDKGDGIDLMLGGGRNMFFGSDLGGERITANDNLVEEWLNQSTRRQYITGAEELEKISDDKQILGLFSRGHLSYLLDRKDDSKEPTLSQMTQHAIKYLVDKESGYFLMVEGGRIDHGHHKGVAGYALTQAQEFAKAVSVAIENSDPKDTLILVTADHSHVFNISGYPTRGNPILGLVRGNNKQGEPEDKPKLAADGVPYTTLGYLNGPGALKHDDKKRPVPSAGTAARQQAAIPTQTTLPNGFKIGFETHAGEDVALYANGPWAHLVGGVLEQNAIFHLMKYAYGWE